MKKLFNKTLLIVALVILTTGCSLKSNDKLYELKPKLNQVTKRVNSAIKRRGIEVKDVVPYLQDKYTVLMDNFKEYDLQVKYENKITVVLICKKDKAIFEDMSCDLNIDADYSDENKPCEFYIQKPVCEE